MDVSYMKDFVIASSFGIIVALDIWGISYFVKWVIKEIIKGVKFLKLELSNQMQRFRKKDLMRGSVVQAFAWPHIQFVLNPVHF